MANRLYTAYANQLLLGGAGTAPDLSSDSLRAILIDTASHTPNTATDSLLEDVSAGRVATSNDLASPSVSGGAFDCADIVWELVSGSSAEAVIIYHHTGSEDSSPLLMLFDTFSAGMPVTPNGGNITMTVNASGLLSLV